MSVVISVVPVPTSLVDSETPGQAFVQIGLPVAATADQGSEYLR